MMHMDDNLMVCDRDFSTEAICNVNSLVGARMIARGLLGLRNGLLFVSWLEELELELE